MAATYRVLSTQPWVYLDQTSRVVNGFRVFYELIEFGETHFVEVASLAPDLVKSAIEAQVKSRQDLAKL